MQDLGYRWGSCGKRNWLYFNWKTMRLPRTIAEYVVVYELVHLHEAHHTPEFWRRLERAMPDYERRKQWLAGHGIEVEGIRVQNLGRKGLDRNFWFQPITEGGEV